MVDTLLRSLRDQVLDEAQPLAGLLRKCLVLGAETGSDALRQWARKELNGYRDDQPVPAYRLLSTPPIYVSFQSGYHYVTDQVVDKLQMPAKAREGVRDEIAFRQPIEELEDLAQSKTVTFTDTGLAYAQVMWNQELEWMQQVTSISYKLSNSVVTGLVGQVRTQLVDLVAELCAETPMEELPNKAQVDAAVNQHIGTQYNTTIQSNTGATAIGTGASGTAGLQIIEVLQMLDSLKSQAEQEPGDDRGSAQELMDAVEDLRQEISRGEAADTGQVVKKARRLRKLAGSVTTASLTAAITGATEAVTTLALSGVFG